MSKEPTEHDVQREILKWFGAQGKSRLYRNNSGVKGHVRFGLVKGASDIIGWRSVEIGEDMIGKRVAIFTALEVKGPKGKVTPEQAQFLASVCSAGGIAATVQSLEEAQDTLQRE